jgi:hypothetical protein
MKTKSQSALEVTMSMQFIPVREPQIQVRLGTDLGQLVASFASKNGLTKNDACKCLIALAATAMDCRYYGLVHQMAGGMGGRHAFVRSCVHIQTALEGAVLAEGVELNAEPERSLFILKIVREYLLGKGMNVETAELSFVRQRPQQPAAEVPEETGYFGTHRRKKRKVKVPVPIEPTETQTEDPEFKAEPERERVREHE